MSAVAALWRLNGAPAADGIERMAGALRIYGPDAERRWDEGPVALAQCRLSLLPEDRFDRQPVQGADGGMVLAAAIRLDNRSELAAALAVEPARLARLSDAGLAMLAVEAWWDEAPARMTGSFAFACWDRRRRRLLCARDALGDTPLFYHRRDDLLAVASMPAGLLALPDVPRRLDETRIARHLLLLPGMSESPWADLHLLPPGHLMETGDGGVRIARHWTPPPVGSIRPRDEAECLERFNALLDDAVRNRLRGDGPVGSHLSGGLDSGTVTATAARLLDGRGARLTAFTSVPRVGYDRPGPNGRPGDEGPAAAALAAMYPNVDHRLVRTGDATPLDELDGLGFALGQPVLNACNALWIAAIAREARRRGIAVLLTGQLGNMTISYNGHPRLPALLASGRLPAWAREAWHMGRRHGPRRPLALSLGPYLPDPLRRVVDRWRGRTTSPFAYSALSPDFARTIDLAAFMGRDWGADLVGHWPLADGHALRMGVINRVDLGTYNTAIRAAYGIDQRDPTADRRLAEFCLGLPEEWYLKGGVEKRLLRLAMRGRIPAATLEGRGPKGYQAADWHEGLTRGRDEIAAEIERMAASPMAARMLDLPRLRRLVEDWPTDGWQTMATTRSYRLALLRGLATGRYILRAEGRNG